MRSTFINTPKVVAPSRGVKSPIAFLSILFAILLTLLSAFTFKEEKRVEAGGSFCAAIGMRMVPGSSWGNFTNTIPYPNATGARILTLEQAFGGSMTTTNYYGESSERNAGNFFLFDTTALDAEGNEKPASAQRYAQDITGVDNSSNLGKMQDIRTVSQCLISPIGSAVGSFLMIIANIITSFMSLIATSAFDSNIVCSIPGNPNGDACFDIVGIIGGAAGNGDGGLIGALTGSIYMPLMIIAVVISAMSIGYKGIVKRQFRAALGDTAWVIVSVFFGVIMLTNPQLLAKAPMAASNSIAACVIGAFNGENCFDGSSSGDSYDISQGTSNNICKGKDTALKPDEQLSMVVGNMGCSIWKAFILEPYSQMNFGTSFEDLDTGKETTTGHELVNKSSLDNEALCVTLDVDKTTGTGGQTMGSFEGKRLPLQKDGPTKVCNLAAYQMYIQNNASMGGDFSTSNLKGYPGTKTQTMFQPGNYDPRWYTVIAAVAEDDDVWQKWAKESGSAAMIQGGMAIITALFGSVVIIVGSVFSLVFYLSAIILIAFAPLFFLLAIHPGRGKKIFLGWLEKLVSNLLKYLASAFFVLIAIAFYGAILGSSTNPMMTFVFVVIMTFALLLYRKELIELMGRVNMGGEQMGNKAAEWAAGKRRTAKTFATGAAGAAIGSALAGDSIVNGLKAGANREAMRGTLGKGISSTARQHNRVVTDAKKHVDSQKKSTEAAAKSARDRAESTEAQLRASHLEGDAKARNLDQALNVAAKAEVKLGKDSTKASDLAAEINNKIGMINPGDPRRAEKIGKLNAAKKSVNDVDKFTKHLRNQSAAVDANYSLEQNFAAQQKLLDAINKMPTPSDPALAHAQQRASKATELAANFSDALRRGDQAAIDKIAGNPAFKGQSDGEILQRLETARDRNIAALGNDDLNKAKDGLMSSGEMASALTAVERGRNSELEIEKIKASDLGDRGMDDRAALEALVNKREQSVTDLANAGISGSSDLVQKESALANADETYSYLNSIENVATARSDIDRHHEEHVKLERRHDENARERNWTEEERRSWVGASADTRRDRKEIPTVEETANSRKAAAAATPVNDSGVLGNGTTWGARVSKPVSSSPIDFGD